MSYSLEDDRIERSDSRETAARLENVWYRVLPDTLHNAFLPRRINDIQLSHNEEIKLVIYQSWYRNFSAYLFANYGFNIFLVAILGALLIGFFGLDTGLFNIPLWNMVIPIVIVFAWFVYAIFENFRYLKYRMIITNRRLIFSSPQPNNWMLSDNIEVKGQPRVIDDNWSNDRLVRNLQIFTGSRDLSVSPVGLQFEGGQVKDGLNIPDVDLEHIEEFKQLILDLT
ncbi:MAG: hypothetical protein AAGD96_10690, partial [Chloroflexota bacterium]